jgi:hypothetical protein
VKLEPSTSPYLFGGNYRNPQTTPSPTPSHTVMSPSPHNFMTQASTSPSPYHHQQQQQVATTNGNQNQMNSILENHLQAPRNAFQQSSPQPINQNMYTPNINNQIPVTSYAVENSSTIWTANNLNGTCVPTTTRATPVFSNNLPAMTSAIFSQPLNPAQTFNPINNNNNNNYEPRSNFSSLVDLDSQQLLFEQVINLSGEMKNLSFDCPMESYNGNDK